MPLTDPACRKAKPEAKPKRMADGGGLYLEVMPNGSKYWRLKYRHGGKEKHLALGVYPGISLKDARNKRDAARRLLSEGVDPGVTKRAPRSRRLAATASRRWRSNGWSRPAPSALRTPTIRLRHGWKPICCRGWASARSTRSRRRSCWRCCGEWKRVVRSSSRSGCGRLLARYSATPSPRAAPNAILPATCAARSGVRGASATMPR